ncbi:MAG: hypothetical protein K6F75_01600 [Butyrivibrio sp.]|nr:hypothetical protein [Butyrivibrio sp.]
MKKTIALVVSIIMMFALMGCKASDEKLGEIEGFVGQLREYQAAAEEKYLDIADTSLRPELDALGVQAAAIYETDFSKLSNKKIDEKIPEVELLLGQYDAIQKKLDGTYQEETTANEELAKNKQIGAYIINKTGFDISSIILRDVTTDNLSDNLIGEGEKLAAGYTLMGVTLEIHTDSFQWEFIVKDLNGTQRVFACDSLKDVSDEGVSMVLDYDPETDSGTVSFGGYFSN